MPVLAFIVNSQRLQPGAVFAANNELDIARLSAAEGKRTVISRLFPEQSEISRTAVREYPTNLPTEDPMEYTTLPDMMTTVCSRFRQKTVLIHGERRMTYGDLEQAIAAVSAFLQSGGITKGDHVVVMLPNVPEFVISYWAILAAGAVAVTINDHSTSHELKFLLENSDARALILSPTVLKRYDDIKDDLSRTVTVILTEGNEGHATLADIIARDPAPFTPPALSGNDPAVMIYSAGLTGDPRGAVLTHANLLTQSTLLRDMCEGTENDRGLCVIPLFHAFGAVANMIAIFYMGGSIVMMSAFSIDAILGAIEGEKVTYIAAVPRLFLGILIYKDSENYDLSSLRLCITGGSKMPVEFFETFQKQFHLQLMEGYGLTEASPVCSFSRPFMEHKPGSIGTPISVAEVTVIDDGGTVLSPGETGELLVKGPHVMKEYYNDPEATAAVMKGEWLRTGDLAYIDEEGYIFLQGLKKRMIITSGFNVYPKEVEKVLSTHPDIQESLVTGKEDLMRGEIVTARVVTRAGSTVDARDIMQYCRTYLSSYKCPREVHFVDALSQNESQ